jgi:C-terminal processing protease CtpA/Prc
MVLTDELSASAAEIFAAVMQDEKRGLIYGLRTGGAGGAIDYADAGFYSEAGSSLAATIVVRKNPNASPQYPAAPYIENIGVIPDKTADIMTRENLLNQGKAFVRGFSDAMVEHLNLQGASR